MQGKQRAWQPQTTMDYGVYTADRGMTTYVAAFPATGYDRFGVRSQALSEHGPCKQVPLVVGTNLPMRLIEGRLMEHIGKEVRVSIFHSILLARWLPLIRFASSGNLSLIACQRPRSAVPAVKKHSSENSMRTSMHNPHPVRRRVIEDLREGAARVPVLHLIILFVD